MLWADGWLVQVKQIVKPGCSLEVLNAALSSMASVTDILSIMSTPAYRGLKPFWFTRKSFAGFCVCSGKSESLCAQKLDQVKDTCWHSVLKLSFGFFYFATNDHVANSLWMWNVQSWRIWVACLNVGFDYIAWNTSRVKPKIFVGSLSIRLLQANLVSSMWYQGLGFMLQGLWANWTQFMQISTKHSGLS
jgi:hypothetical protein